jgi:hypothetical protein
VGTFLFHGIGEPLVIHELLCTKIAATERDIWLSETFAQALRAYAGRNLLEAGAFFAIYSKASRRRTQYLLSSIPDTRNLAPADPGE